DMLLGVLHDAEPPRQHAQEKETNGARKDELSNQTEVAHLLDAKSEDFAEAAGAVDLVRPLDVKREPGLARKGSQGRQQWRGQMERQEGRRAESQRPSRPVQERQDDQAGDSVVGEDVAVPDQVQVDEAEGQQDQQATQQQAQSARMSPQSFMLNGEADAEQQ